VKRDSGFSLIELLVALLILSILVALSVLTIVPFRRSVKTEDAAGLLFTVIRQGRLQAITRRQFYAVVINTSITNQSMQLSNSTKSLNFLSNSVSLVDMGRASIQNDEEISLARKLPEDVNLNGTSLPASTAFPLPERNFTVHDFSGGNLFVCYLDPAGRAVNSADGAGTQEYRTFYFSSFDIDVSKSATLLRAITLYGATGGLKFWRYDPASTKWISKTG
jgi:prepilin-type N-terminal cleavage/methylation domain-containing protein